MMSRRGVCPDSPVAVLSGPTFAHEVAAGLPTAVTVASTDAALAEAISDRIALPQFRVYLSDDVPGAEVGGAVKNVLAIACGVVEGKRLGQNARAAVIARGFAEMTRFGLTYGAREETLAGLAGLGDLVLTCNSTSSRNFSLGQGHRRRPRGVRADGRPPHRRRRRVHRPRPSPPRRKARGRHAAGHRSRRSVERPGERRRASRTIARPSAARRRTLEIDRDALLFPVAVARRVEPAPPRPSGGATSLDRLRLGYRGEGDMGRGRIEMLGALHASTHGV